MSIQRSFPAVLLVAMSAQSGAQAAPQLSQPNPSASAVNPFLRPSTLPYEAPPFDLIEDRHYQPALEQGLQEERAEIDRIAASAEPPTFLNTVEAMERSGQLLRRSSRAFGVVTSANTNPTLQKLQAEMAPKYAAHRDATYLNPALFARIKTVYESRNSLAPEARRLAERYYRNFVRAGALLAETEKTTLRALNQEESRLTTEFRTKLLADVNASALVIDDAAQLEGLTDNDLAAAVEAAKARKLDGKWVLPLQNTTQQPAQVYLKNRALRERLFTASQARGDHDGPNDMRPVVTRLAEIRAERAKILGFPNYAAFFLDDQMAKTPERALALMTDIVPAATARAANEAAAMQKRIDAERGGFTLRPWDWQFYSEQVRKADYAIDESQLRPYFELERVLRDGVFFAAQRLYGLTFKERQDIPPYHPDVRVFEVFEADGTALGLYYADFFARPSKLGGAWANSLVSQTTLLGTKPVVTNAFNFTKPAPGRPALLSLDETTTMFHEFGHTLHSLFSNVRYPTSASTPRDFVEFPSQFNEHWALDATVLANYAKHHETGAPMPASLVDKIMKTRTFGQGFATTEYLAAALVDMAWHTLPAGTVVPDVSAFESAALERFKVALPLVPPRYRTGYFLHIWANGYSAAYYSYIWSEVLDTDAYEWFKEHGGLTRANGQRFRDLILAPGGSEDPATLFRTFRGRDPIVEPLLVERGLK